MSLKDLTVDDYQAYIYHVNYILRNVVPVKDVGEINSEISLNSWLRKNGFNPVWTIKTSQFSKIDIRKLSHQPVDMITCHDPFKGLSLSEIEQVLQVIDDKSKLGAILSVPNFDYGASMSNRTLCYNCDKWLEIFSQISQTTIVHNNFYWSLFLVLK